MAQWFYNGDINLQCGGFFYRLGNWQHGYVDCVRVTPCSDAGAQSNAFWIEALTVIIPADDEAIKDVLSICGYHPDELTGVERKHRIVDACMAYGRYDPANCFPLHHSETVQIGKIDPYFDSRQNDPVIQTVTLRANASLERYVRREFLNGRAD